MKKLKVSKELLIILAFIIVVSIITLVVNLNLPDKKDSSKNGSPSVSEIPEPEAPLSKDFTITPLSFEGVGSIKNIVLSPDKSKSIIVTQDNKLVLVDKDRKVVKTIEEGDTLEVKFNTNNQIYYQKAGTDYGIFSYLLPDDKNKDGVKKKLIESADEQFFDDIAFINENKYFFIQPKTGKFGFGDVNTGKQTITGQKTTTVQSIMDINLALYMNPVVSSNGKMLFVTEKVEKESRNEFYLRGFLITDTKLQNAKFSTKLSVKYDGSYSQTLNGKYLIIGQNSLTVNTETVEIVYSGPKELITNISFSPDQKLAAICSGQLKLKACRIEKVEKDKVNTIEASSLNTLPDNISQMNWLDNENLIFTIDQSIYRYELNTKLIEKLTDEKSDYQIVASDNINGYILIRAGSDLKELKKKTN